MKRTIRNSYYAYKLIDSQTNQVFYVGKGFHARMYAHKTEALAPPDTWTNPHKCRKILKILANGGHIKYEYVLCPSEQEALLLEQQWIDEYKLIKNGGCLTNISDSGQTANPISKPIDVYDKKGRLLHTFCSSYEAARQLNISDPTIIGRCLHEYDRLQTYKGMVFQYRGEPFNYLNAKIKIVVATNERETLTFEGTKNAALFFNKSVSCIRQHCREHWVLDGYQLSYQE